MIGIVEEKCRRWKMTGNNQINAWMLKTLLVNKIGLYVVFQELFIPLHQTLFDNPLCQVDIELL